MLQQRCTDSLKYRSVSAAVAVRIAGSGIVVYPLLSFYLTVMKYRDLLVF